MATRATMIVAGGLVAAVAGYLLVAHPATDQEESSPSTAVTSASVSPWAVSNTPTTTAPALPPSRTPTSPTASSSTAAAPAGQRRDVERFALRFMHAFAKPARSVSYGAWWARVASMLTDDAVDSYAGITPAVVPFRKVTGPVTIEPIDPDSDAFWVQPVSVGTDAGMYRLLVQLPSAGFSDRLLVIEIQEP